MSKFSLIGLLAIVIPTPVVADKSDMSSLVNAVVEACLFETLDFDAEFEMMTTTLAATGLPLAMEQAQSKVFGDFVGLNIVAGRKIDELSCFMRIPAPQGTKEVFQDLQAKMDVAIDAAFPKHLEEKNNDPSPHVEGFGWVASFPGKMHYAASLEWGTETGVQLAVGFRQLYE